MKHKLLSLTLAPVLAAGLLVGCSNDADEESSATTTGTSATATDEVPVDRAFEGDIPTIGGEWGKTVTFEAVSAAEPDVVVAKTLIEGEGEEIGPDDVVAAHYHGVLWDGKVFDSTFDRAPEGQNSQPLVFSLNQVIKGWKHGLAGQHVGDRVELVIPAAWGYGDDGAGDQVPGGATLVFVVDLVGRLDPTDTSALTDATQTDEALPAGIKVEGALGEKPTLTFDEGASEPEEQTAVVIAEGNGPAVTENDAVSYHITGAFWSAPDQGTSTWDSGLAEYSQQAIGNTPGFSGMNVGSRVLVVQPGGGSAKTSVYIVDITGAVDISPVE